VQILSQLGLLEVPVTYLGGRSSKKLMLNGGGGARVCSLLSLIMSPKRVCFACLTLTAEYWGSGRYMPLNKAITITRIVSH
jgi:hypothetical protein